MSIKQLLESGGNIDEVGLLMDPQANKFTEGPKEDPKNQIFIKDSAKIKSGKYSRQHIEGLSKAAKVVGVSGPYLVALSLQETGLGDYMGRYQRIASDIDISEAGIQRVEELSQKTGIGTKYLRAAIAFQEKLKYADHLGLKDDASRIQAYNGYGKLKRTAFGGDVTKAYGVEIPEEGIDLKKNPLYGKRVLQLAKDIEANKEIMSIINSK